MCKSDAHTKKKTQNNIATTIANILNVASEKKNVLVTVWPRDDKIHSFFSTAYPVAAQSTI